MRARFSAYATGRVLFLRDSAVKAVRDEFDEEEMLSWSRGAKWHGLEIVSLERGGEGDDGGVVEFRAAYTVNGGFCNHHERSTFVRENGEWKFEDGEMVPETPERRSSPKVGRNDPCPCGSGKKFKKCCGAGKDSRA